AIPRYVHFQLFAIDIANIAWARKWKRVQRFRVVFQLPLEASNLQAQDDVTRRIVANANIGVACDRPALGGRIIETVRYFEIRVPERYAGDRERFLRMSSIRHRHKV